MAAKMIILGLNRHIIRATDVKESSKMHTESCTGQRTAPALHHILNFRPAKRVSGQKWKTDDISPAMQKPHSRHCSVP